MTELGVLFGSPWPWLIGGLVLMTIEALAPGFFLLWIGLGAIELGLFVALWPGAPVPVQLLMLAVCMLVSVVIGARLQTKGRDSALAGTLNSGLTEYIGREVLVVGEFQAGVGRVRVDDTFYQAFAVEGSEVIQVGERVMVQGVRQGGLVVQSGL